MPMPSLFDAKLETLLVAKPVSADPKTSHE
jgi:hypothetical protein